MNNDEVKKPVNPRKSYHVIDQKLLTEDGSYEHYDLKNEIE